MDIQQMLRELADPKYKSFHAKLIPDVPPEKILGVRKPQVDALARQIEKTPEAKAFLAALPHAFYDENALHGALICRMRSFDDALAATEDFLPYVDNWAVCDMLSPKAFAKNLPALREKVEDWLRSERTYTVRFGLVTLMAFFLDGAFAPDVLELAASVRAEAYYIRMAQAWFFCTALCKQYEAALPYLTQRRLEPWVHNKTIQKCVESYRLTKETKEYLKTLKISD